MVYAVNQACAQSFRLSETKYDWTGLAGSIVGGSTDKYEQSYKIYRWLCDNIAYDVDHKVYTADECYEQKKGVCQAYSELFYRLADAVDLETEVILGYAKEMDGSVDQTGHAWVKAYMEDYSEILIDPTWGAGSIYNGAFRHIENDDTWFDVDPEWMIFTHWPSDEEYQMLEDDIDSLAFVSLPYMVPAYEKFGQDGKELLNLCLEGAVPQLPVYYPQHLSSLEIGKIPVGKELRVGQYYDFILRKKVDRDLMVRDVQYSCNEWVNLTDGYVGCRFMPSAAGETHVAIRMPDGKWQAVVTYTVAPPTAEDISLLETHEPHRSPLLKTLGNYEKGYWEERGLTAGEILERVKAENITCLPAPYVQAGYDIVDIPLSKTLKAKEAYTFTIRPLLGIRWAMIINGKEWLREWTDNGSGTISMTVQPKTKGSLLLAVQTEEDGPYQFCLEYVVE